jgi:hypothetical protein
MMNWAHVDLLVNDVPILASLFAALFFLLALDERRRSRAWAGASTLICP